MPGEPEPEPGDERAVRPDPVLDERGALPLEPDHDRDHLEHEDPPDRGLEHERLPNDGSLKPPTPFASRAGTRPPAPTSPQAMPANRRLAAPSPSKSAAALVRDAALRQRGDPREVLARSLARAVGAAEPLDAAVLVDPRPFALDERGAGQEVRRELGRRRRVRRDHDARRDLPRAPRAPGRSIQREQVRAVDEHGARAASRSRGRSAALRPRPSHSAPFVFGCLSARIRKSSSIPSLPGRDGRDPRAAEDVRRRSVATPPSPRARRRTTSRPACRARPARARPARRRRRRQPRAARPARRSRGSGRR